MRNGDENTFMLMYKSIMYCILNTVWSFDWVFCFSYPSFCCRRTERYKESQQGLSNVGTIFLQQYYLLTFQPKKEVTKRKMWC